MRKEGAAVRVHLYKIDCPEKGQVFGQKVKQFTSDQVFGKSEAKVFQIQSWAV